MEKIVEYFDWILLGFLAFVVLYFRYGHKISALKKPKRKTLKDVKPGENINFTGNDGIVYTGCTCIGNDIKNKKLRIMFKFKDGSISEQIREYNDYIFKDFELIHNNVYVIDNSSASISYLMRQLKECEAKEDYERAKIIKEQIDKLKR